MNSIQLYAFLIIAFFCSCSTDVYNITSPDGSINLEFIFDEHGVPYYSVLYKNDTIVQPSKLGVKFAKNRMDTLLSLDNVEIIKNVIPYDLSANRYFTYNSEYNSINALVSKDGQKLNIIMRAYNDGIAIRYFTYGLENAVVVGDMTEVKFKDQNQSVLYLDENKNNYLSSNIIDINVNDKDDYCYTTLNAGDSIYLEMPLMIKDDNGKYISLHVLPIDNNDQYLLHKLKDDISIYTSMVSKDEKGRVIVLPCFSPWLILSIAETPKGILESGLDYNLRLEEENPILPREYPLNIYKNTAYGNIISLNKNKRTTMAHDLALSVIFNKKVEMYDGNSDIFNTFPTILLRKNANHAEEFINSIPKNWEEMIVLDAELCEYIITARRGKDSNDWVIGGATNDQVRNGSIPLDFLRDDSHYEATMYSDDINSNRSLDPDALIVKKTIVNCNDSISFDMLPNGGFTITIKEL